MTCKCDPDECGSDENPKTEMEQIVYLFEDTVHRFFRIVHNIHHPFLYPYDCYQTPFESVSSDLEKYDIEYWLSERLGGCITSRRNYFKYREAHHEKLAQGLESAEDEKDVKGTTPSSVSRVSQKAKVQRGCELCGD